MRTSPPWFALTASLLAACASAPQPSPRAAPEEPSQARPAQALASMPAPQSPDVPEGDDAARDAELKRKVTPLVDAFLDTEAILTRDGKRVIFTSNRDGLPQLYIADATRTDSPAKRLLEWTERMSLVTTTPDGQALLFRSDKGANENWSIWKVGLDGSAPVELTPGDTMNRQGVSLPELAPDTIFFSGMRKDEVSSAVYAVPASGGAARMIHRDDKPGFLMDVSRDGRQGLFMRYLSGSETYLQRLDLKTGEASPLYPLGPGKVTLSKALFSPDGRTVYVATDGGTEQMMVLALDARSGKELARYVEKNPASSLVSSMAVAKTGDAIALGLDAGNHSELRLLDARTLQPRASVAMPLGLGEVQDFSEDGQRLTAIWSTPSSPTDAWVIDTRTGKAALLRTEPRASLKALPPIEASITSVRAHDGLALPVNVYLPKNPTGKLPVIVCYHGGPAGSSKIRWSAVVAFFVSQGYAWVEPNVRGSGGFGRAYEEADNGPRRLEAFKDIETTGRWAASQPWADASRVIVYGGSYGGYTVLVGLTRMPDLWRAGVDLFGVANMKTFMATTSGLIREIFLLEMGDPDKDAAFLDSISPLRDADRIVDPLFVYAGANDPRVPRSESDQVVHALRERKIPVEYMVAANEGHSILRKENLIEFLARAARFLEKHAGPVTPAQPR